jgi:hypothetical protein
VRQAAEVKAVEARRVRDAKVAKNARRVVKAKPAKQKGNFVK